MRQKCIICGSILEPSKENEKAQIEYLRRNKLPPSELCTQLASTLGECKDGGNHETTFDSEDRKRMANIIVAYDTEILKKNDEVSHNRTLIAKRDEILKQLRQVGDDLRSSAEKIAESECDIETISIDYEEISGTSDIDFYRKVAEETKS